MLYDMKFKRHHGPLAWGKNSRGMKLTTTLCLILRLKMGGDISQLLHVPSWCAREQLYLIYHAKLCCLFCYITTCYVKQSWILGATRIEKERDLWTTKN